MPGHVMEDEHTLQHAAVCDIKNGSSWDMYEEWSSVNGGMHSSDKA